VVHSPVSVICWDSTSHFGWFPTNEHCHSEILGCCNWQWPSLVFSHFSSLQEDGILLVLDWLSSEEFACGSTENAYKISCTFSSPLCCACLGAPLSHDLQSRLEKMFNGAVRVVYGLRKFDHVCALRRKLEWLSVQLLIQHHCLLMLCRHYHADRKHNTVKSINSIWQTITLWDQNCPLFCCSM